ncbi:MAG: DNA adenine methylase [Bacteroidetes bacterium]|nr:DNA adenine methylase [Bacteroidota bacterium]
MNIDIPLPTQPLRYIGSKYRMTPFLIEQILKLKKSYFLDEFREVFVGTGSVSFEMMRKKEFSSFLLNDIDPAITCYFLAIRDYPEQLINRIKTSEFSKIFYAESIIILKKLQAVPLCANEIVNIAFRKLFVHRYSFSGLGVKSTTPVTKGNNRWNDLKLIEAVEILHARAKNSNLKIENKHYFEFLAEKNDRALIYLDPPYVGVGEQVYQFGFNFCDHIHLAESIKNSPHPFILSYDNHELVLDLYSSWTKIMKVPIWYPNQNSRKEELIITPLKSNRIRVYMGVVNPLRKSCSFIPQKISFSKIKTKVK